MTSVSPVPDPDRFWPASSVVSRRLADRPWMAFLSLRGYFGHIKAVLLRVKWWQVPVTLALFPLIVHFEGWLASVFGLYVMGYLLAPLIEEGAKAWSLRTFWGRRILGGGFVVTFAIVEGLFFLTVADWLDILGPGIVVLRILGVLLHFYTHMVQAYGLSLFGVRNRAVGSFISAVLIHGAYNAATTGIMVLTHG